MISRFLSKIAEDTWVNKFSQVKLAIQLLQTGANIKKESEEIVNLDEGVPDEGE